MELEKPPEITKAIFERMALAIRKWQPNRLWYISDEDKRVIFDAESITGSGFGPYFMKGFCIGIACAQLSMLDSTFADQFEYWHTGGFAETKPDFRAKIAGELRELGKLEADLVQDPSAAERWEKLARFVEG